MIHHARVIPGYDHFGINVHLYMKYDDDAAPVRVLRLSGPDVPVMGEWEEISPHAAVEPTLRLDNETARALLDALLRHYMGSEDTRALRRDYDGERKRVDDLIGHLSVIAMQATAPPLPPSVLTQIATREAR